MTINGILEKAGRHPARKRRGRGQGSGLGKTSGRGHKGARCRSGWKNRYYFEGGQMPLIRRVPKRGFTNAPFTTRYDLVNVGQLEVVFESGDLVNLEALMGRGVVKSRHGRLKVLGEGELSKSLTVVADKVSESARRKVESAGGSVETPARRNET